MIHEIIFESVNILKSFEDSHDYLALPCYFLLKIKEFYSEYKQFPNCKDFLNSAIIQNLFNPESDRQLEKKKEK